jgi:hypothetical protein
VVGQLYRWRCRGCRRVLADLVVPLLFICTIKCKCNEVNNWPPPA